MEGLGVDKNISQGFGVSDLDGYESSSSEDDVFARKKGQKRPGGGQEEGADFAKAYSVPGQLSW
jgi:hypothetical protein